MPVGPLRRRIAGDMNLGTTLCGGSKCCVVERCLILIYQLSCSLQCQAVVAFDSVLPIGIGLDQAGIDRNVLPANRNPR